MNLTPDDLIEALQVVQELHARNMVIINIMIDSESEVIQLKVGDEQVKIEGEMLKGFKIGLIVAKGLIGNLPFNLTRDEQDAEPEQ